MSCLAFCHTVNQNISFQVIKQFLFQATTFTQPVTLTLFGFVDQMKYTVNMRQLITISHNSVITARM